MQVRFIITNAQGISQSARAWPGAWFCGHGCARSTTDDCEFFEDVEKKFWTSWKRSLRASEEFTWKTCGHMRKFAAPLPQARF